MKTFGNGRVLPRSQSMLSCTALIVILTIAGGRAWAGPVYSVTDLGTLPGGSGYTAFGINASGQIVGTYNIGSHINYFLYSNGSMTQIAAPSQNWFEYRAISINDSGQIGTAGINDSGQTISNFDQSSTGAYAVFNNGTTAINVGALVNPNASTMLTGLNNNGEVVGWTNVPNGSSIVEHPFIYNDGQVTQIPLFSGAYGATATAVNDKGQVVGGSDGGGNDFTSPAYLYSAGKLTSLGTLGGSSSVAEAINNNGLIVGESDITASYTAHAFLYANGTMMDLNSLMPANSGWVLTNALGINAAGQIVGFGTFDGQQRAFVLNPDPVAVPEPSTLWFFGIIVGGAFTFRRRITKSQGSD